MSRTPPQIKRIAVVGDRAVGKSSLVKRLLGEPVDFSQYMTTIDDAYHYAAKMPDGAFQQIQIIDTAPWNEFPAMQRLYIEMAHLVIAVYDASSSNWVKSITNLLREIRQIREDADILVVGAKSDKLTNVTNFTPRHVLEHLGEIVDHTYISAVTQAGLEQLNKIILTKNSMLTRGHLITDTEKRPKLHRLNLKRKLKNLGKALTRSRANNKEPQSLSSSTQSLDSVDGVHPAVLQSLLSNNDNDSRSSIDSGAGDLDTDDLMVRNCQSLDNRLRVSHESEMYRRASHDDRRSHRKPGMLRRQDSISTPHLLGPRESNASNNSTLSDEVGKDEFTKSMNNLHLDEQTSPTADELRRLSLKNSWKRKLNKSTEPLVNRRQAMQGLHAMVHTDEEDEHEEQIIKKVQHEHERSHRRHRSDDTLLIVIESKDHTPGTSARRSASDGFTNHRLLKRTYAVKSRRPAMSQE